MPMHDDALRLVRSRLRGAHLHSSAKKYTARLIVESGRPRLTRPRLVGWQHIVSAEGQMLRATTRRQNGRNRLKAISGGPFATAAASAIERLSTRKRLGAATTIASLVIPHLMVQALWLRSRRGDRYWILAPSHSKARASRLLTPAQFIASLIAVRRDIAESHARALPGVELGSTQLRSPARNLLHPLPRTAWRQRDDADPHASRGSARSNSK